MKRLLLLFLGISVVFVNQSSAQNFLTVAASNPSLNTYVVEFTRTGGSFPLSFGNDGVSVSIVGGGAAIDSTSFVPNTTGAPWSVNPGASSDQGVTLWLDAIGPGNWADNGTLAVQLVMSAGSIPVNEFNWSYLFEIAEDPNSVIENGSVLVAVPEPEWTALGGGVLLVIGVAVRRLRRAASVGAAHC